MRHSLVRLLHSFRRLFAWWFGELAAFVPASLRRLVVGRALRLEVEMSTDAAVFRYGREGAWQDLGRTELSGRDEAAIRGEVAVLLERVATGPAAISLLLPTAQTLRPVVDLPLATAENLREVLALGMDDYTPFKAAEVYFDYRVVDINPDTQRVKVDLFVASRAVADAAMRRMIDWGLRPSRLWVGDDRSPDASSANLLPASAENSSEPTLRWATRALAACVCVLLAVAAYVPFSQQQRDLSALRTSLSRAKSEATQAETYRQQLDQIILRDRFLVDRKSAGIAVVELLHEVTRILPDNSYLIRASLRGNVLKLSGYTPAASSLVGFLERSSVLSEVRFGSPVTRDPRIGLERFDLLAITQPRRKE